MKNFLIDRYRLFVLDRSSPRLSADYQTWPNGRLNFWKFSRRPTFKLVLTKLTVPQIWNWTVTRWNWTVKKVKMLETVHFITESFKKRWSYYWLVFDNGIYYWRVRIYYNRQGCVLQAISYSNSLSVVNATVVNKVEDIIFVTK